MPITRRGFLGACMSAGAFALTRASADASVQRARWYLFGTLVDVSIRAATPGKADQALADLGAYLSKVNREWNAWKPGALSRLNAAIARGEPAPVEGGLARLIGNAQLLQRRSAGLFNPAIGQSVGLWGLHSDARPRRESPALALLERVLAIGKAMPGQFSSTAQDIGLGKPTEIDALNGYVARRGAALGVPTPVNRTLHALVKLLELGAAKPGS